MKIMKKSEEGPPSHAEVGGFFLLGRMGRPIGPIGSAHGAPLGPMGPIGRACMRAGSTGELRPPDPPRPPEGIAVDGNAAAGRIQRGLENLSGAPRIPQGRLAPTGIHWCS